MANKKNNVVNLRARKGGDKIVMLTSYAAPFTRIADRHADILLVGDSLGMVLYAMETTLGVTLEMMIAHGHAVAKTAQHACVVVDMPFGSYQQSKEQAYASAARVMAETGCDAIKLEGGAEMAETIRFLVERAIPVMGHVGLKPQHVRAMGGYRTQGKTDAEKEQIMQDAKAVSAAGAFSIVLEGVIEEVAREVTATIEIPTIGIGASPTCDGQVLVAEDMLGLNPDVPAFVKRYAELGKIVDEAVGEYAAEVRSGAFPSIDYCYSKKN